MSPLVKIPVIFIDFSVLNKHFKDLRIIKKSAYLSERENQKKTQYFKLDILVGKVYITKHPQFINEDEKAVELKGLVKEYKEKADLTIIPHLRN